MSITTYSELQTAVATWLHRNDLTAVIPDFITLAEAKFNRLLRVRDMEDAISGTITSGAVALPADFAELKSLYADTSPPVSLQPKSLEWIRNQAELATTPLHYAFDQGSLVFWPSSGDVAGTYYARIPALSASNTTNWLLTKWPDLYLFGALEQSAPYLKADQRLPVWQSKVVELLTSINADSKAAEISGGRLVVRAR